jgi:hypothetical protein
VTVEEMDKLAAAAVATWPPFTPEQRDKLYILLAPMRAGLAARAAARRLGRAS